MFCNSILVNKAEPEMCIFVDKIPVQQRCSFLKKQAIMHKHRIMGGGQGDEKK